MVVAILLERIAERRGLPRKEIKLLYLEMERRDQILKDMVKRGIFNFFDVFPI